ncbi:hypothetical protein FISHEDRAFT_44690 [Fistulina hepatica ATCC 64428]|uniref:DUF6533 domain-containing protein n=1 Tax=Fistulina hepatica ATCC 64428 TaxID=1128425 RepID=A0A0D7AA93_9AGAR|nr:hypothetical protein FISHEDRAFT_44690 [Fistulina hepatica ATCC 64428]
MTNWTIVNPDTPLAYLDADFGFQLEVSRYIYVASLGAYIWDILSCIPTEYKIFFKQRFTLVTAAYFLSRISALTYIIISTIFQISPVSNCNKMQAAIGAFMVVAVSSSAFLFYARVGAIYNRNRYIMVFFGLSWLSTIAGTLTVPLGIRGIHIGPTSYCVNHIVPWYTMFGIIFPTCNDALIFFSVSWRIAMTVSQENGWRKRLKAFFGLSNLPAISAAVLQTGQQYYIMTLIGNIACLVMVVSPSLPPMYRAMMTIPNIAILSSMACRVYRNIKFGALDESTITISNFSTPPRGMSTSHGSARRRGLEDGGDTNVAYPMLPILDGVRIDMSKTIEISPPARTSWIKSGQ